MSRGRGHVSHRVLRPFLLIAVALAVGTWLLGAVAHADTPPPVTPCGGAVSWSVGAGLLSQEVTLGPAAVAWAYGQVAPVARLTVHPADGTGSVDFHWIDAGTGDTTVPGDAETTAGFSDRKVWQHSHTPSDTATQASVRALVLRDVLHDLGIASPSSGATGLSRADRAALTRACSAPATTAVHPRPTTSTPGHPGTVTSGGTTPAPTAAAPKTPAPFHAVGLALGAVVLLVAAVYAARPGLFTRARKAGATTPAATS